MLVIMFLSLIVLLVMSIVVLLCCSKTYPESSTYPITPLSSRRTLIVYVYYSEVEDPSPLQNLDFFIKHGTNEPDADYLFILNSSLESFNIPKRENLFIWQKNNECFDLGSFKQGVDFMTRQTGKNYDYYVMINSSVRGPFLPTYYKGSWLHIFISRLSSEVKMVGTTANCQHQFGRRHVQSMVFALDKKGYELGQRAFQCHRTKGDAILDGEIPLTGYIEDAGYKTAVLMTSYLADPKACDTDDMNYPGQYHGMNFHPYELVFIKTNRAIDPNALDKYTEWHNKLLRRQVG